MWVVFFVKGTFRLSQDQLKRGFTVESEVNQCQFYDRQDCSQMARYFVNLVLVSWHAPLT